ncbi:hypothetical protein VPH35_040992 [Triticum aestivum]
MASLAIPDELLVNIFLRLPTSEDLIHASAASSPTAPSSGASARSTPRPSSASSTQLFTASTPPSALTAPRRRPAPSPSPPTSPSPSSPPPAPPPPSSPPPPGTGPCGKSATAASSSTDPAATTPVMGWKPSSKRCWCATPCTGSISCSPQSPMTWPLRLRTTS